MRLVSPYSDLAGRRQYKASLHNHTFKGGMVTAAPSVVVGIYRLCGIQIVAVTEHDRRLKEGGIAEGNVLWREEDWRNPYDDALLIKGFEASFPRDHVLVLGCMPADLPMVSGEPGFIEAARQRGAFTVLNHPARWNESPEHVINDTNLSMCDGLEVYSGARVAKGAEGAVAAPLWDACLSHGLKFFALGSSDCHTYDFTAPSRPTNGWTVLWLEELTEAAVFAALRAGRFYASSGLEVDEVCVEGGRIRVEAAQAVRVRFVGRGGKLLKKVAGCAASYEPQASDGYVRVELDGKGTPFPGAGAPIQAWLQPVWIEVAVSRLEGFRSPLEGVPLPR
jgi:hypothetical protein